MPNFIPLTKEEAAFNEKHKDENWRMVTWPFGGVVEDEPGCGKGWIWFDIAETVRFCSCRSSTATECHIARSGRCRQPWRQSGSGSCEKRLPYRSRAHNTRRANLSQRMAAIRSLRSGLARRPCILLGRSEATELHGKDEAWVGPFKAI